jgi:hypothetical protein
MILWILKYAEALGSGGSGHGPACRVQGTAGQRDCATLTVRLQARIVKKHATLDEAIAAILFSDPSTPESGAAVSDRLHDGSGGQNLASRAAATN